MPWPIRRSVEVPTCTHHSHSLLRRCKRPVYGEREVCEFHLASCWEGCPPVRFVWWGPRTVGASWRFKYDWTDDDYGNKGILIKIPFSGVLAYYYGPGKLTNEYWYIDSDEVDQDESLGD